MSFAPNIYKTGPVDPSFRSPGAQYYPSTYWFWHSIPSPQQIKQQLGQMLDAGFKTFFIQPRLAFPMEEYLSKDYLLAYRNAMEIGHELGLTAGLYDDYNWNSGHAGGRTVTGHDSLRERQLFWASSPIDNCTATCSITNIRAVLGEGLGSAGKNWSYEDGKILWGDWKIFKALAYPADSQFAYEEALDITSYCQITQANDSGCHVMAQLPKSIPQGLCLTVFISSRCITSRMMNYLNPQATERFIEIGYEPYYHAMSDFFGDPLAFIFFDQPHAGFYTWHEREGNITNSLMFDERLAYVFEEKHHYPLEKALLSFIKSFDRDTPRLRCDFFETYGHLAQETFFKPVADWARKKGLAVAGHEIFSFIGNYGFLGGFSWIDNRCNMAGDYFAIDAYKDISTVDACNSQPQIDTKVGDSVAKANGRQGCIVEQYYVSKQQDIPGLVGQWELTLDEVRSQAIRHQFFGARQFLFHGFYQTDNTDENFTPLKSPRFDFAPGINFEPWFYFHSDFAIESARLSAFLDSAESKCDIAVLYPLHTYWAEGSDHPFGHESGIWNRWLLENGYGFDIIDERQIQDQQNIPGTLSVGTQKYKAVILPAVSIVFEIKTLEKLASFTQSGGLLLASGPLPSASQKDELDIDTAADFAQIFNNCSNAIYIPGMLEGNEIELNKQLTKIFEKHFLGFPKIGFTNQSQALVWSWMGADEKGWSVALFNDSLEPRRVMLSHPKRNLIPQRWYPQTGKQSMWGWFDRQPSGTNVYLEMEAKELACFRLLELEDREPPHLIEASGRVIEADTDNDKGLSITILCGQSNPTQMDLYASTQPKLNISGVHSNIQALDAHIWRITLDKTALPLAIELNSGWKIYTDNEKQNANIDIGKGWQEQGYPTYSGLMHYECVFDLPSDYLLWEWELIFPRVESSLEVYLNQELVARRGWPPYQFLLPQSRLRQNENHLKLTVANTGANHYYHGTPYERNMPDASGIIGTPLLQSMKRINIEGGVG